MSIVQTQLKLDIDDEASDVGRENQLTNTSTFTNNMSLPIHRWFRYSAGFSAEWVESEIRALQREHGVKGLNVLDPFVGSGTVLLASDKVGSNAIGIESHPFVSRITQAKILWRTDVQRFKEYAHEILECARDLAGGMEGYPPLIYKCYPESTLKQLDALKTSLSQCTDPDLPQHKLTWLALVAILRVTSPAGTAQWQYILPNKNKAKSLDPFYAFEVQIDIMAKDMLCMQSIPDTSFSKLYPEDARFCESVGDSWADLVITSPPYANNYDYADATRLEMSFLGEVAGWGDLQTKVRKYLIRSSTQHVSKVVEETWNVVESELLRPIYPEILDICNKLYKERDLHGGKKNYHAMIAHYFFDLAQTWHSLRRVTKQGGTACFVIGDSAPYGVYVPVDRWLGELAVAAGFKQYNFEKIRDRNVKWKNRKHKVPLHEGRLWVKG